MNFNTAPEINKMANSICATQSPMFMALDGFTDKTLSKELKSLETNKLINRKVHDTFPPTVLYSITTHGQSLEKVLEELHYWG